MSDYDAKGWRLDREPTTLFGLAPMGGMVGLTVWLAYGGPGGGFRPATVVSVGTERARYRWENASYDSKNRGCYRYLTWEVWPRNPRLRGKDKPRWVRGPTRLPAEEAG